MSFSSKVKEELGRHLGGARHCKIAETTAILNMCGEIELGDDGSVKAMGVHTENAAVARKYFTLLKKTFNIKVEVSAKKTHHLNKHRVYTVYMTNQDEINKVLTATRLICDGKFVHTINPLIVQTTCCKRAYIRGAFLAGGSISDPEKTYHMEFVNHDEEHGQQLMALINSFEMDSKMILRKKNHVVYLKEGNQIVDLLNIMEAHIALLELENLRILKEMRNNVNRIVNCETANLNKTVSASVNQVNDIEYIENSVGLHTLSENLEAMARVRLENPSASLKELGELLDPPVGKSGVNHRLRKLSEIAEKIRSSREDYHD